MQTGHNLQGHPALRGWLEYGLGSENEDLARRLVENGVRFAPGEVLR